MNNVIKYLLGFSMILNFTSCGSQKEGVLKQIEFTEVSTTDSLEFLCKLEENIDFIDNGLNDFEILTDSTFILANSSRIYIYNTSGQQIKTIGRYGKGPGEYLNAMHLFISDNYIYVWCDPSKLIVYEKDGTFVREHNKFHSAIRKFVVTNDNMAYFYGIKDKIITSYDLVKDEYISEFDDRSDADELLFAASGRGAVCEYNNEVLYAAPSRLLVSSIVDNAKKDLFEIIDSDFHVELDVNISQIMVPPFTKLGEYLESNSWMIGIHSFDDNIYIAVENGEITDSDIISFSERKISIFKIDDEYNPVVKIVSDYPDNGIIRSCSYYKNYIYFLLYNLDDSVQISRIKLDSDS